MAGEHSRFAGQRPGAEGLCPGMQEHFFGESRVIVAVEDIYSRCEACHRDSGFRFPVTDRTRSLCREASRYRYSLCLPAIYPFCSVGRSCFCGEWSKRSAGRLPPACMGTTLFSTGVQGAAAEITGR